MESIGRPPPPIKRIAAANYEVLVLQRPARGNPDRCVPTSCLDSQEWYPRSRNQLKEVELNLATHATQYIDISFTNRLDRPPLL